jgi:nicotinamidase-related amidase
MALAEDIAAIAEKEEIEIELVGLCTDICVVSNALLLKAFMPEVKISVDPACCAGVTPESHEAALKTMQMCQIHVEDVK